MGKASGAQTYNALNSAPGSSSGRPFSDEPGVAFGSNCDMIIFQLLKDISDCNE